MDRRPHEPGNRYPSYSGYEYGFVDEYQVMREARRMQAEAIAQMFAALWLGLRRLVRFPFTVTPAKTERHPGQLAERVKG